MLALLAAIAGAAAQAQAPTVDYAGDAKALDRIIVENYAYDDHWPGKRLPDSIELARQRAAVRDRDTLLRYAEDRIASLADHHAITGSSFPDSWAVVPTYSDLWVERRRADYVIDSVRPGSPAAKAGIAAGARLIAVDGVPTEQAVAGFWRKLGLTVTAERADYAARVLAAGRRDRPRNLTFAKGTNVRPVVLPSLYAIHFDEPPLSVIRDGRGRTIIKINNSLGEQSTVAAFDSAMAALPRRARLVIDLTDTPSGGNSSVARAMLSWFVREPRNYQMHELTAEERETGIARRWIEQVLPRPGKSHGTLPVVRVGRWTGSMGEGIAIGFAALGAPVEGTRMAQLKGAVYDFSLPSSGMMVKLPAERLYTVSGQPREDFVPATGER